MADGTLKVGTITNSAGSGNITIGSGVTVNVNRPSFFAYLNATQSIADSTDTTVQMAAELWDTDSAFDTSTYKFTVPTGQAGKYWFYGAVQLQALTNEDEARAMIYKNTSTRLTASRYFQGQNGTINYQCGVAADLSVGDTVEFKTRQVSGGAKNAEGTSDVSYFLGYRIGA
jgi:hypothetical protein